MKDRGYDWVEGETPEGLSFIGIERWETNSEGFRIITARIADFYFIEEESPDLTIRRAIALVNILNAYDSDVPMKYVT